MLYEVITLSIRAPSSGSFGFPRICPDATTIVSAERTKECGNLPATSSPFSRAALRTKRKGGSPGAGTSSTLEGTTRYATLV